MIEVLRAQWEMGHSGHDHLLSDRGMAAIIGRRYRTLQAAANAATRAAGPQPRRCAPCPVWIEYTAGGTVMSASVWPT